MTELPAPAVAAACWSPATPEDEHTARKEEEKERWHETEKLGQAISTCKANGQVTQSIRSRNKTK